MMAWWVLLGLAAAQSEVPQPAEDPVAAPSAETVPPSSPTPFPPHRRTVSYAFGEGLTVRSADDRFALRVRGRVQLQASVAHEPGVIEHPTDVGFQVRRARLSLSGHLFDGLLGWNVQLGVGPRDVETDLPLPLRDAFLTWRPLRDLSVRAGQMKVPFSRERTISSSSLQLVDRSIVNAELNLDRDVGLTLFSDDLGGLDGRFGYAVGVFGGEGRNRWGEGTGLLYVARVQVQPLGSFGDAGIEADLSRDPRARLSLGGAVAFADEARRARVTHGDFLEGEPDDVLHAAADVHLKAAGFSLLSEFLWRRVIPDADDGVVDEDDPSSGLGWFVQAGYLTPADVELAARWAEVYPLSGDDDGDLDLVREGTVGLSWYALDHDAKLQADYAFTFEDGLDGPVTHTVRLQTQICF